MDRSSCAFTGHRPSKLPWKYDETSEGCVQLKKVLTAKIKELAEAGITTFLSGMAEGSDQICAEIVLALRKENPTLQLHCIVPFRGQADKWSPASQERYHAILEQANQTVILNEDYTDTCMKERNHYLVEHSSILLAVYKRNPRSGTGSTVSYARKLKRKIYAIDPRTCEVACIFDLEERKAEAARLREKLGADIKKYREEHNETQAVFAKACGMSVSQLYRIENGIAEPGAEKLIAIADHLEIPTWEYLISLASHMTCNGAETPVNPSNNDCAQAQK